MRKRLIASVAGVVAVSASLAAYYADAEAICPQVAGARYESPGLNTGSQVISSATNWNTQSHCGEIVRINQRFAMSNEMPLKCHRQTTFGRRIPR